MKKCFVISPIGEAGSPVREHVDDVFDFIIKPAAEAHGYAPMRADHDNSPGTITEQMYDRILQDDMLIAILTFANPNVFYEIAIAEAAARPLILMIERGHAIPFDIANRRVIQYEMKPRGLISGEYSEPLARMINELSTSTEPRAVPFRPSLAPLTEKPSLAVPDRWQQRHALTEGAVSEINIQGLALSGFRNNAGFMTELEAACRRGVQVRVMLASPDNDALPYQLSRNNEGFLVSIGDDIRESLGFWQAFKARGNNAEVRLQTREIMYGMLFQSENGSLYQPYLGKHVGDSPTLSFTADARMHKALLDRFNYVWRKCVQ